TAPTNAHPLPTRRSSDLGWLPSRERGGLLAAELAPDDERLASILGELDQLAERFRSVAHRSVGNMEWRRSFHFPREVMAAEAREIGRASCRERVWMGVGG